MIEYPEALRRKSEYRLRYGVVTCILGFLVSSCGSMSDPDNAPALGTIGGVTAGALIGAASGSTGTGAFIGSMIGRGGGEIVKHENSPSRAASDSMVIRDMSATIRSAERFDSTLPKSYDSLARRRANSPATETLVVRAEAKQKLAEIHSWINLLAASDRTLSRAIGNATGYPSPNLGKWLNQRNQIRTRLASLRTHQSWFKPLTS